MKPRKPPNSQNNRSRKRAIAMYGVVVPIVNNVCADVEFHFVEFNNRLHRQ